MAIDWENFLDPYIQKTVGELKIKLRGMKVVSQTTKSIPQIEL